MKTYLCDKCGAEFDADDYAFGNECPECFSDQIILLFTENDPEDNEDILHGINLPQTHICDDCGAEFDLYDDDIDDFDDVCPECFSDQIALLDTNSAEDDEYFGDDADFDDLL